MIVLSRLWIEQDLLVSSVYIKVSILLEQLFNLFFNTQTDKLTV